MLPQIRNKKSNLSLSLLALIAGLLLSSCASDDSSQAQETQDSTPTIRTVEVETMVLESTPFEDMIALIGVV